MRVTNKVFIVILPKEILLDTNTLSVSTSSKNLDFFSAEIDVFFNFNITIRYNFFTRLLYTIKKNYF